LIAGIALGRGAVYGMLIPFLFILAAVSALTRARVLVGRGEGPPRPLKPAVAASETNRSGGHP
jgi:hypothetical protein